MSKKNRNKFQATTNNSVADPAFAAHKDEYKIISRDLIRVVILNLAFLGIILAVYYTNLQSGYLEKAFEKIF